MEDALGEGGSTVLPMSSARLPVVAVVGRPNVGKSTLVNRVLGARQAVVEERPGVTRDRREFTADWAGRSFLLVDTGGWESLPGEAMSEGIRRQAEAAVSAADAVLFVVDSGAGVSEDDAGAAAVVRRAGVPVILAANKVDDARHEWDAAALWRLGLGEPQPVGALHGRGVGELLDRLVALFPEAPAEPPRDGRTRLAIVGRPNVGKSTLLNRLAGEERVLVSEVPGTTRDPIDVVVEIDGEEYRVVDTAGMRRLPKIGESADYYAVLRAREAMAEADIALLVVDALDGVTQQDQRIASEAVGAGVGLVLVLNKWDALEAEVREETERSVGLRLGFVGWAPVLRISALTGARLHRLGRAVEAVTAARTRRIATGRLNRLLRDWTAAHPPPTRKGRRPRLLYGVQAGVEPPTFVLFVSGGELGPDYLRFLEGRLRTEEDFTGTPIHLVARARSEGRS
jgi:GTPase